MVADKPMSPGRAKVVMTLGRSVTLSWTSPEDDGGCKIGNYIVEYYRVSTTTLSRRKVVLDRLHYQKDNHWPVDETLKIFCHENQESESPYKQYFLLKGVF